MQKTINKKIVLAVTGGIAAYKSAEIVRQLQKHGCEVRVIMTASAKKFITPLTLQALSGHRVHDDLFDAQAELAMGHIELARWADAILIAPASANTMAKLAHGQADDLLTTICLATTAPIIVAPAMNQQMWLNHATQANLATLAQHNIKIIEPASGEQACGEVGPGRLAEPDAIVQFLLASFKTDSLTGQTVVITTGPTQEALDPIRYLTNHSSGKMGFALAAAAAEAGAKVILIAGPVALATPDNVTRVDVISALEMQQVVAKHSCDIFIAAAAVADYRPAKVAEQKIKKSTDTMTIELEKNPDIVAEVAAREDKPFCVGFCLETENLIEHAEQKLQAKNLDCIIANAFSNNTGANSDTNAVEIIWQTGQKSLPLANKTHIAQQIIGQLCHIKSLQNR